MPPIVDVHGHITSPAQIKRYPMPPSLADIDGMLDKKAEAGIGLTIVGTPVGPGTMTRMPGYSNYDQAPDEIKAYNEWIGQTVGDHADRMRAYAYVNPFGGERQLADAAAVVGQDGFVGLVVNTSVRGEYLDSERADDFFAMVKELHVPVLLHPPAEPVGSDSVRDFRLVEQIQRYCDVLVGLAVLIFSGRLERDPDLTIIAATSGGGISLVSGRLDTAHAPRHWGPKPGSGPPPDASAPAPPAMQQQENRISRPPSEYLRRVYVDTTNGSVHGNLANLEVMGADRIMFGTDSPPLSTPLRDAVARIDDLPIPDEDKQKIFSGNAKALFKLDV